MHCRGARAQSDEIDYLMEGLLTGGAAGRRAAAVKLVDACASPHSRVRLRLSGCLRRLLEALAVAEAIPASGSGARLNFRPTFCCLHNV